MAGQVEAAVGGTGVPPVVSGVAPDEIRRDAEFDGRDARATRQPKLSHCQISLLNSTAVFADGLGA
jgi:hypothetical protein